MSAVHVMVVTLQGFRDIQLKNLGVSGTAP